MLAPDYPLLTERLLLRPPTVEDAAAVHIYKSRADVTRYIPHGPLTFEQIHERHAKARTRIEDAGQALNLLAFRRDTGELVGDVVLFWHSVEHRGGEVGYILDPAHNGHGYATELARFAVGLGFAGLGLHRMVGRIDPRNEASARVLERVGMRKEAHFISNEFIQGEWTDEAVYAVLEDDWRRTY
ncbi:MAG TPA: GNAT family protein [Jatrophihabitans sp.]